MLNFISMGLCIGVIYFETRLALMCREKLLIAIPMIVWMIHSLTFYGYVSFLAPELNDPFIVEWSKALRLQGYGTVLMLSVYRFLKHRR